MNLLVLSWKNIWDRKLSTILSLILMMLGIAIISLMILLQTQIEQRFTRNLSGIDMVVGAKGSPLQLILSSVFHLDAPTGNISLEEANKLTKNRLVKSTIPVSYGDTYQGYRIVGTTPDLLDLYQGSFAHGKIWSDPMEVVVGSHVAEIFEFKIGDEITSTHGLAEEGAAHDELLFTIVGILEPGNSVLDQLILTDTESIWNVHNHEDSGENEYREITAMLVKFASPMGMIRLPRMINQNTSMMAALPAYEINRLFGLMGVGFDTLNLIAMVIIVVSGTSVFVSLYNSLKERKSEIALLRGYGATRLQVLRLILQEGFILSFLGSVLGLIFSRMGFWFISNQAASTYRQEFDLIVFHPSEGILVLAVILLGIMSSVIPAFQVYRSDISHLLEN